ncbi:hemolysin family protein [Bartonella sp. DGB1]|uniref:hemolysin family protein n=1 Tax=Bartonella sp. DGB1 TaxID=3239807 RepID=UPI0035269280
MNQENPGQSTPEKNNLETEAEERSSFFSRIFSKKLRDNKISIRENLRESLANGFIDDSVFSTQERNILTNILSLRDQRIDDIMIPRADIKAFDIQEKLGDILVIFSNSSHSRMPVYDETLDDPKGMVHIKDVLNYITNNSKSKNENCLNLSNIDLNKPLSELDLIRPVLFVPNSMPAAQLMNRMQTARIQMALVIDEHGGTDGLVSLEDVVELIVGDIEDEHDNIEKLITQETNNSWISDARIELADLKLALGDDFIVDPESAEEVDTLGGLIVSLIDRIPTTGETIDFSPHFKFQIIKADSRRIIRVRVRKINSHE